MFRQRLFVIDTQTILYVLFSQRPRVSMEPSVCRTSSCTATRRRSMSTAMCGTACWTGSRGRPPLRSLPGARCRVETRTARRRKSTVSQPSSCQRWEQGAVWLLFWKKQCAMSWQKASLVFLCRKEHFSPRGPQEGLCLYVVVIIGVIAVSFTACALSPAPSFHCEPASLSLFSPC